MDLLCGALGIPPPKYTWVDKDGIDATQKEGEHIKKKLRVRRCFRYSSNFLNPSILFLFKNYILKSKPKLNIKLDISLFSYIFICKSFFIDIFYKRKDTNKEKKLASQFISCKQLNPGAVNFVTVLY